MRNERITRAELVDRVERALDRALTIAEMTHHNPLSEASCGDIRAYVAMAPRVAAGTWSVPGDKCFCPASGAGLDRLQDAVRQFAGQFDMVMDCEPGEPAVFEVRG